MFGLLIVETGFVHSGLPLKRFIHREFDEEVYTNRSISQKAPFPLNKHPSVPIPVLTGLNLKYEFSERLFAGISTTLQALTCLPTQTRSDCYFSVPTKRNVK